MPYKNRSDMLQHHREYYQKNKESMKLYASVYYTEHPELKEKRLSWARRMVMVDMPIASTTRGS